MYVKLFASLYQGTLRGCPDEILVFTNLLAHADAHGIVDKHWRAIAEETGLSKDAVLAAIKTLESPDPESRSPELDGRRIVLMDTHRAWGWQIVNYGKYRAIKNADDRREQNRAAQERFRDKQKVSVSNQPSAPSAQGEGEGEGEGEELKSKALSGKPDVSAKKNEEAIKVLDYLNKITDRHYRPVASTLKIINARLQEGYTGLRLREIALHKVEQWAHDDKMSQYLRPETLYNATKCAGYDGEYK